MAKASAAENIVCAAKGCERAEAKAARAKRSGMATEGSKRASKKSKASGNEDSAAWRKASKSRALGSDRGARRCRHSIDPDTSAPWVAQRKAIDCKARGSDTGMSMATP